MARSRIWLLAALPAALALLGWLALPGGGATPATAAPAPRPLPVVAAPLEPASGYTLRRTYSGALEPRRAADLGWELAGRVAEVQVEEGQRVAAGQLLARLESDRAEAELAALVARARAEAARLEELERGPRAQTLAAARAELRGLEEELALAVQRRERRAQLAAEDFVSTEEVDEAATAVEVVAERIEAARQRLDELEEGTRPEELARQRARVEELASEVERARVDLADRELRAPFDALVTRRDLDEGAVVAPGARALRLVEADALEARFGLPPERARELAPGDAVTLLVGGVETPAEVRARLAELDPRTRTVELVVALSEQRSRRHVAGEVAELVLEERVERAGAWIPTAALVPGVRGLWAAWAVVEPQDGAPRVERHELELLHTEGARSYVRGTPRGDERFVVEGAHRVVPGQHVAPMTESAP